MSWMMKYYEAFGSMPFVAEPSNTIVVEDENGTLYVVDEPEEKTLDRIQRSKEAGRNLFFEELPVFQPCPETELY